MPFVSSNRIGNRLSHHVNRRIPKNSVALMRSIEVIVAGMVVGYIQSIAPNEARALYDCREVGNEDLAEIVPGGPEQMTISVRRMLLYKSRIQNILDDFGGNHGNERPGIRSLMDYNVPFDIMILMRRHDGETNLGNLTSDPLDQNVNISAKELPTGDDASTVFILDWYHECWLESLKYDVKAEAQFQIEEDATIRYTWRTGSPLFTPQVSPRLSEIPNVGG